MTPDLERRLREDLRAIPLPVAPPAVHDYLDDLRARGEPVVRRRHGRRLAALVAAAAALLVLATATLFMSGSPGPTPRPSPSPSPSGPSATTAIGPRTFVAPGITFEYPLGWTDQSAVVEYPAPPGLRFVALIARGMTVCAVRYGASGPPTPQPSTCEAGAGRPGTATVSILEYTHPYPWLSLPGFETTINGYSAWKQDPATWIVRSPDDGLYVVTLVAPSTEVSADGESIGTMLESLRLSAWDPALVAVDGRLHEDPARGFSFDYPAGWSRWYPQDISMMDSAVVTIASGPLAPCTSDSCQNYVTPPGTIAIQFRIGNGPTAPDWSTAPTTIGGQPAFKEDWGPANAAGADEGHTWSVRLADPSVLGIYASLHGPGLVDLRAAMSNVLASVRIVRPEPSSP
jgi:hypothetical protein